MKKIKASELNTLLRENFTNACKNNGFEYHQVSVDLKINSIYAKLTFSFIESTVDSNKAKKIADDFSNNLKKYVGNNIIVNQQLGLTQTEDNNLILQVDYDIVE